jgi:hypothetical protein
MSNKNVRVKFRILVTAEEVRDKSNLETRPGRSGTQRKQQIDIPTVEMNFEEFAQRLSDVERVLQYGPDVDNDNPPVAVTNDATGILHNAAAISGHVWLPQEIATTVTFDYGLTEALGSSSAAAESPVAVTGPTKVTATLAGLTQLTKYYYRTKAVNATKTVYGLIKSFTTVATP